MDKKVEHCYRCGEFNKNLVSANEKLSQAICEFGNAVDKEESLLPVTKNEIIGIINSIVGGYPSTLMAPIVFETFSKIVNGHIYEVPEIKSLWDIVEDIVNKSKT